MTTRLIFVVLGALLWSAPASFAQETTGSIEGTVRDASKGVLPGVSVTVAGPAIMGPRTVVTGERGSYTVRSLPPGKFEIRASLQGFASIVREQIEVRVGQTATIDFDMSVAGVTESTIVTAEAPVIDLRRNSRNFTIDTEAIAFIPLSTSQQYTDFWVMAPGVRDSLATSTGSQSPSINGASGTQNKVFVDGIDVGDHVNASTTTYLNNAIIQEVAISTGGVEAQTGFGTGGVMNIVTKSGGNEFHGGASMFLTPKRFNGTNFPGTSPANVESYYPEGHLGGPIRRDRLWFFASEKYLYENTGIFNVTSYKSKIRSHEFYAKASYQPHQRHRLAYVFQHDRRLQDPSFGIPSFTFDATPVGHFGGYTTGVNWDYQIGRKTLLAVVASYFDKPNQTDGRNGTNPRTRFANAAGSILTTDGNYDRDQANEQTRPYFSGVLTRSFSGFGGHDLRLSTELYPRTSRLNRLRLNIIETYRDSAVFGPRQLWTVSTPRPLEGAENNTIDRGYAFGIQDAWRPLRKLTVNGGLRYESNRTEIEGRAEKLLDYDSWSPRIGAA
ncbi:MAG TPA: TonB-dependent receptor, partial [Vicinamibacterales bacterium]|nr:TonB-dependent receptor [Vicinamibacterales bacterium]